MSRKLQCILHLNIARSYFEQSEYNAALEHSAAARMLAAYNLRKQTTRRAKTRGGGDEPCVRGVKEKDQTAAHNAAATSDGAHGEDASKSITATKLESPGVAELAKAMYGVSQNQYWLGMYKDARHTVSDALSGRYNITERQEYEFKRLRYKMESSGANLTDSMKDVLLEVARCAQDAIRGTKDPSVYSLNSALDPRMLHQIPPQNP
mmetsp:Transcript_9567/g.15448  ORF Transcript_9567/g.15448 Transcript_9567/m.15448 type:complete len:207 (+) Transcript_9567:49-669(+)